MPKINRSDVFYYGIPDDLTTKALSDAKLQVSLNVTVPKGFEKVAQKIIVEVMSDASYTFKQKMEKAVIKRM